MAIGRTSAGGWPETEPTDVRLAQGNTRLAVDLRGGGVRELVADGWPVLDGYPAGTVPQGRRGGVLLPWPNRLRDGRWAWNGRDLQLEVSSPQAANAAHGLLSWQPWDLLAGTEDAVTVGTVLEARPGYPFRLAVAVDYVLARHRLGVTVRARNVGAETAPVGVGMHPYLAVGAREDGGVGAAELILPARTELVTDGGLPTGGRRPFDGAVGPIGERVLDVPLTDLIRDSDGWARVFLRGAAGEIELAVDASWPWLQAYTGDTLPAGQRRRSVAIEPMTCPPNALADHADLILLEPGQQWSGSWTLRWTPSV
jgi:aldose 1-epimerase